MVEWALNRHSPFSVNGVVLHLLELGLGDDGSCERVVPNCDGVS